MFASIAVRAIMAWKLHLQSPRFTLLLLAVASPVVYFWAADKNVLLFLLAQHYALLGFVSLVTQTTAILANGQAGAKCPCGWWRCRWQL